MRYLHLNSLGHEMLKIIQAQGGSINAGRLALVLLEGHLRNCKGVSTESIKVRLSQLKNEGYVDLIERSKLCSCCGSLFREYILTEQGRREVQRLKEGEGEMA